MSVDDVVVVVDDNNNNDVVDVDDDESVTRRMVPLDLIPFLRFKWRGSSFVCWYFPLYLSSSSSSPCPILSQSNKTNASPNQDGRRI